MNTLSYHLLPYHCLDIVVCGYLLVKQNCYQLTTLLTEIEILAEQVAEWFAYFLALHDIGKYASNFQNKCPDILQYLIKKNELMSAATRHDSIGFMLLNKLLYDSGNILFDEVLDFSIYFFVSVSKSMDIYYDGSLW